MYVCICLQLVVTVPIRICKLTLICTEGTKYSQS